LGLLYFPRNEPRLPEGFRAEARRWNLPKDEFAESGHFPPALYVREARRFPGAYVFTEHDVMADPVTQRSRLQPESVAVGDYVINSHGVDEARAPYPDVREGYVVFGTVPYQIPYGLLTPTGGEEPLGTGGAVGKPRGFWRAASRADMDGAGAGGGGGGGVAAGGRGGIGGEAGGGVPPAGSNDVVCFGRGADIAAVGDGAAGGESGFLR
jgi:hypothetical protein